MNFILKDFSFKELEQFIIDNGFSKYRAQQIYSWLYKHGATNSQMMHNLSDNLKLFLDQNCTFETLSLSKQSISDDTVKFLFKTESNQYIESVSMLEGDRHTICLSSQVGCNVDCDFCATGKMGFKQNLSTGEIIDQLLFIKNYIKTPITNIVFMGMGEPFLNYKNVIKASNIMNDKNAFNIGARRITISTAGILPKINQFINENIKYNLAISLNASNDSTRDKLMPINKKWPIRDLINAAKDYNNSHRMKITFEYVLIDSVNDSIEDASKLGLLLKNTDCKLNIIPFNEIGSEYKRPSNNTIENFVETLHQVQQGFRILVRWSKGTDINAGCGQLATNE